VAVPSLDQADFRPLNYNLRLQTRRHRESALPPTARRHRRETTRRPLSRESGRAWVRVKFNRRQGFVGRGSKPFAGGFESLLVG